MSIVFSDTSNLQGLVQFYEKELGFDPGEVSGNPTRLKIFTAESNQALDDFTAMAITSSGTWQYDDSSYDDYPIITTDLIAGQRDYTFTEDETGNLILDIYKVLAVNTEGKFCEIYPVDVESQSLTYQYTNGLNIEGVPCTYDKTGNGIFLNPIPNYGAVDGLKMYINRESSYFTTADTTKKPGVPGLFHKYFYLKPAYNYARINNLANFGQLQQEILKLEGNSQVPGEIKSYFASRARDERVSLQAQRYPYKFR